MPITVPPCFFGSLAGSFHDAFFAAGEQHHAVFGKQLPDPNGHCGFVLARM